MSPQLPRPSDPAPKRASVAEATGPPRWDAGECGPVGVGVPGQNESRVLGEIGRSGELGVCRPKVPHPFRSLGAPALSGASGGLEPAPESPRPPPRGRGISAA